MLDTQLGLALISLRHQAGCIALAALSPTNLVREVIMLVLSAYIVKKYEGIMQVVCTIQKVIHSLNTYCIHWKHFGAQFFLIVEVKVTKVDCMQLKVCSSCVLLF